MKRYTWQRYVIHLHVAHTRAFTLAHTHTYILANHCVFIYGYDL